MKYVLPVVLLGIIVIMPACQNSTASEDVETNSLNVVNDMTGQEVWDKTINYHDPDGKWATFSGKVSLVTSMDNGWYGQEVIEVDNESDTYRHIRTDDDVQYSRGTRGDTCFLSVDGKETNTESDKEKYGLDCETTHVFKQHHSAHIGMPMLLKEVGVELEPGVSSVTISGKEYYALRFTGNADTVVHPYWTGERTMYVDSETLAMYGVKHENVDDTADGYFYTIGKLEVSGINIAQVRVVYRSKDDSFHLTDVFSAAE